MDNNVRTILMKRLEKTAEALRKNNMDAYVTKSCEETVKLVEGLLNKGDVIASGGTMSMAESGVLDLVKNGDYIFLDRSLAKNREETEEIYRKAFSSDVYMTSANAVTENGEIYNVDGNSNRVAAIAYGPKSVIFIVGYNKLVGNIEEAVKRVKTIAAPANCVRLGIESACSKIGGCVSLKNGGDMCNGCQNDTRVCCNYLVSAYQRHKGRFKVILVAQELGY